MFCIRCGRQIPEGSTFCTYCGQRQGEAGASGPDAPPAAPAEGMPAPPTPTDAPDASPVQVGQRPAGAGRNAAIVIAAVAVVLVVLIAGGFLYMTAMSPRRTSIVKPSGSDTVWGASASDGEEPVATADLAGGEEFLREDVASTFDSLTTPGEPMYWLYIESFQAGAAGLDEYGIDAEELGGILLEGVDYEIVDVDVDEAAGTGTVYVTAECKSLNDIMDAATASLEEVAEDPEAQSMSEEQINELIGQVFVDKAKKAAPRSVDLEFDYTYNPDIDLWVIDGSAADEMYDMFFE